MALQFAITMLIQRLLKYKTLERAVPNSADDTEHKKLGLW